jgi:thiamine-monophosphate kinase
LPVRFFDDLMRGLATRFAAAGTAIVGGNLARAELLAIDVTLAGRVQRDRVVHRRGAGPGDLLLVTGSPGDSAAGLALLQHGAARRGLLPQRFLAPEPRLQAGRFLAGAGVTAMIDVSDGISTDVQHLCDASGVDVEIHWDSLQREPRDWVLHGGEAYELLCTMPAALAAALQRPPTRRLPGFPLHAIGRILPPGSGRWLLRDGKREPLRRRAFEHFDAGTRRRGPRSRRRPTGRPAS